MANPNPRKEALQYVAAEARKTGKTHRFDERAGEDGERIIFAVDDASGAPLFWDDKPIECSYRPLHQDGSYT